MTKMIDADLLLKKLSTYIEITRSCAKADHLSDRLRIHYNGQLDALIEIKNLIEEAQTND